MVNIAELVGAKTAASGRLPVARSEDQKCFLGFVMLTFNGFSTALYRKQQKIAFFLLLLLVIIDDDF